MTLVEQLASFATRSSWSLLSTEARASLKIRVLDSVGCALGAISGEPCQAVRAQLEDFGGRPHCSLIGGGCSAPDRAAFYNGALVRYLDFNDSYLSRGETCHPSDNLASILAAAEYANASGRTLLTALALAYQVQCRLSAVAPVRHRGFDHTTQGAYAVAAGVSRALGLDTEKTAHAIAISGTACNALRVTRTGKLSHWKGLAYPHMASVATQAAFLARHGITGPKEVFEGNKGFMETISGPFSIDWTREDLEQVQKTVLKRFNAEIHAQSAVEGALELRAEHGFRAEQIEKIELDVFDVAYQIIGGGEEGEKTEIFTKEQADHSLPYMVAAALLDGQLLPAQYAPERITRPDVQGLLRRVLVRPDESLTSRFPKEHPCRIQIRLHDGRVFRKEKRDYEGFHSRPMSWEAVVSKFERLARPFFAPETRAGIIDAIARLEEISVFELCARLCGRPLTEAERKDASWTKHRGPSPS